MLLRISSALTQHKWHQHPHSNRLKVLYKHSSFYMPVDIRDVCIKYYTKPFWHNLHFSWSVCLLPKTKTEDLIFKYKLWSNKLKIRVPYGVILLLMFVHGYLQVNEYNRFFSILFVQTTNENWKVQKQKKSQLLLLKWTYSFDGTLSHPPTASLRSLPLVFCGLVKAMTD